MSSECLVYFMLRYCWAKIAQTTGKVDRVLSIILVSLMVLPQSRSWATMRWSLELNARKFGKSITRRPIQSLQVCGRKMVFSCFNRASSVAQNSIGSLIWIYCCWSEESRCRWEYRMPLVWGWDLPLLCKCNCGVKFLCTHVNVPP